MGTYTDVQLMTASSRIQEYEIELKIETWKKRHMNAHIIITKTENYESPYYKHAIFLIIKYQANSKVSSGYIAEARKNHLYNYPSNYDSATSKGIDANKGLGYVARENGKFGSFPSHDDYSDDSSDD